MTETIVTSWAESRSPHTLNKVVDCDGRPGRATGRIKALRERRMLAAAKLPIQVEARRKRHEKSKRGKAELSKVKTAVASCRE